VIIERRGGMYQLALMETGRAAKGSGRAEWRKREGEFAWMVEQYGALTVVAFGPGRGTRMQDFTDPHAAEIRVEELEAQGWSIAVRASSVA
jgi:hypothetical protein